MNKTRIESEAVSLPYAVTFTANTLNVEPMHGPIHPWGRHRWIIVGSETGNRKERVVPKFTWLMEIRDFALMNTIPLFFKESLRPLWTKDGNFPQEYPVWA